LCGYLSDWEPSAKVQGHTLDAGPRDQPKKVVPMVAKERDCGRDGRREVIPTRLKNRYRESAGFAHAPRAPDFATSINAVWNQPDRIEATICVELTGSSPVNAP
jgi:hypothetical protein